MSLEIEDIVLHKKFGKGKVIDSDKIEGIYLIYFYKENVYLHDGQRGLYNHCWWVYPDDVIKSGTLYALIERRQYGLKR